MHFICIHHLCVLLCVEEHQSQLVQCGGLPLIITLLTEDTSEEVRKAAMFILQTCKQASKSSTFDHVLPTHYTVSLYSYLNYLAAKS